MKTILSVLMSAFLGFCLLQTWPAMETSAQEGRAAKRSFTKHFEETLFDITTRAEFSVEILPDDKEYKKLGKDVVGIVIHNFHDEDVEKAAVAIDFGISTPARPWWRSPWRRKRGTAFIQSPTLI